VVLRDIAAVTRNSVVVETPSKSIEGEDTARFRLIVVG
jgi:hypothetical protein